jgi:hypothetical protein
MAVLKWPLTNKPWAQSVLIAHRGKLFCALKHNFANVERDG